MAGIQPIETDRLILREYEAGDFELTHRFSSDPRVVRYVEWGPNRPEDTRRFIEWVLAEQDATPRSRYQFAIDLKGSGLIGTCSLTRSSRESREAELAYVFNPRFWGNGYGTESAKTIVTLGFHQLNLHRIYAKCVTANGASANVMEKLGMKREGLFREHRLVHGQWLDYYYYAILEHEWKLERTDSVG